ncbi:MAG: PAS domain-containing protein [Anaerolineales bacterium]|nr:PAS domain-containing protein [Anaerolineales bacterium]
MNRSQILTAFSLRRRNRPTLADIEILLDLLPEATLLLDVHEDLILLSNARATELTAFTRAELARLNPESIFPGVGAKGLIRNLDKNESSFATLIRTHNGSEITVDIELTPLDQEEKWILVVLIPSTHRQRQADDNRRREEQFLNMLVLCQSLQEPNIEKGIHKALEAGHKLTGGDVLVAYLVNPVEPGLTRAIHVGHGELLPQHIPPDEITTLLETYLWMPGKRANTSLQRAARVANYTYLACTPLGDPQSLSGVLVIAGTDPGPSDDLLPLLLILGATISATIQHHTFTNNLTNNHRSQESTIIIGDMVKETVMEGLIQLAPDLTIVEMNPFAEMALGFASLEVSGQPIDNILVGPDNLIPALQAAQQGIPTHNLGNVHLHRRDGVAFLAQLRILPSIVSDQLEGILIFLRDLSEHEQVQLRNQQLEQRAILGEVTAIFAHEVRNPINNISTGLQLMAMNLQEGDSQRELISRLDQDCNRVAHLIDSILSFARPAEHKIELVDINLLIDRLLERWRPRMARVKIQHHLLNASKNPYVSGDSRALEQVFTNLVSNAVQAMNDQGGTLSVTIRNQSINKENDQVEISVADNGPGISEEHRQRIFEPFFTTNKNGTGLGLAIAKRIISAHKGVINVTSVPGGTVFQVLLPSVDGNKTLDSK